MKDLVNKFTIILALVIAGGLVFTGLGSRAVENSKKLFDEAKKFRTKGSVE